MDVWESVTVTYRKALSLVVAEDYCIVISTGEVICHVVLFGCIVVILNPYSTIKY
jgi:hypothetical protein